MTTTTNWILSLFLLQEYVKKKYIAIYNLYHFYAMVNDIAWACSIINIQMKSHVLYSAVCSLTVLRNSACNIKNENVWNVLLQ